MLKNNVMPGDNRDAYSAHGSEIAGRMFKKAVMVTCPPRRAKTRPFPSAATAHEAHGVTDK